MPTFLVGGNWNNRKESILSPLIYLFLISFATTGTSQSVDLHPFYTKRTCLGCCYRAFQKSSQLLQSSDRSVDQFICSSLAVHLINSSRDSSNYENFVWKNVHNFLFIDHIDQSECSRIRYSILIGQLRGSCESFKELLQTDELLNLSKWIGQILSASIAATVDII